MVVRFNTRAVQDVVVHRVEPIGVEGDALSSVPGGVTEAEAIIGKATKHLELHPEAGAEHSRLSNEIIEEEEKKEPGPELDTNVLEKARQKAQQGQKEVGMH